MAGAISGTAITNSPEIRQDLSTITLTINCLCNYKCPHCYLDYSSIEKYICDNVIDKIFQLGFRHLAVVGKEPFADKNSVNISRQLVELCYKNNKSISFVTNGLNLDLLQDIDLQKIKYLDISFDGGIQSYNLYRGGDINKILKNISLLQDNGLKEVNALHVLTNRTIYFLSDMIELNSYIYFNKMMFSPYLDTHSVKAHGKQKLSLEEILGVLKKNNDFMKASNAFLLLDKYNFVSEQDLTLENIELFIKELDLKNKILLFKEDPIQYGFLRITYNGFVLTPTDSLNTSEYDMKRIPINEFTNDTFCKMLLEINKLK